MGQDIRSITQVGTSEVFELQVARGQIPGHTSLYKFGFNPDVDNALETVGSQGGLYSVPVFGFSYNRFLVVPRRIRLQAREP